jgi:hypothetical protein
MTDFIAANEEIFIALCGIAFLGFVMWLSWASRRDNVKSKDATDTEKTGGGSARK